VNTCIGKNWDDLKVEVEVHGYVNHHSIDYEVTPWKIWHNKNDLESHNSLTTFSRGAKKVLSDIKVWG
jgi:hypothetical protein